MRTSNPVEGQVLDRIAPLAADLGFRIVRVRLSGLKRKRLQIMAEREADGFFAVEDCEALSRSISAAFEIEDPIPGEYDLEVSSPGIDRPLVRIEDFARFLGHEAKLETSVMLDGRRRFRGALGPVEGEAVSIVVEGGARIAIPFAQLAEARLVLTDKLIEEDLKRHAAANPKPPKRARKDKE